MRLDLLKLLGVAYLTDALTYAVNERKRTEAYMIYETDCLQLIGKSLGIEFNSRFYDILHPEKIDNRPAEEIAEDRLERFGIKVVD